MKYVIGYWCPRGEGHFELYDDPEYDGACGGKGIPVLFDLDPEDITLDTPTGEWMDDKY